MGLIIADITMSLDGFVAGDNIHPDQPMGKNGALLHEWIFSKKTDADAALLRETSSSAGAVITGGFTYNTAIDKAWGGVSPFEVPAFVLCTQLPKRIVSGFVFVQAGIERALEQAKKVAAEKNVWIMGGANVIQQYLNANLVDVLQIHIAPILLKAGVRLFDLQSPDLVKFEIMNVTNTPGATHIFYRVIR